MQSVILLQVCMLAKSSSA